MEKHLSEIFPDCTETVVFLDSQGNPSTKETASTVGIIVTDKNGKRVHEVHGIISSGSKSP
jgi:bisphosphoglycerate-independent phosphoglycerate mutase (AlkP superfamily)